MYAVIRTGGKQYKVSPGDRFKVELLEGEKGASIELSDVLLFENEGSVKIGKDAAGVKVKAEIVMQGRAKKVLVFKHKRRKSYRKMNGHRQYFTELLVKEISA